MPVGNTSTSASDVFARRSRFTVTVRLAPSAPSTSSSTAASFPRARHSRTFCSDTPAATSRESTRFSVSPAAIPAAAAGDFSFTAATRGPAAVGTNTRPASHTSRASSRVLAASSPASRNSAPGSAARSSASSSAARATVFSGAR